MAVRNVEDLCIVVLKLKLDLLGVDEISHRIPKRPGQYHVDPQYSETHRALEYLPT